MTALHVYFTLRNQQAFQRLLDTPTRSQSGHGGAPSTSGGKSWTRPNPLASMTSAGFDVNARDPSGRTVLHLAASAIDAAAPEYVRKLLAHPHINVNLPDKESHWTALHRALYHGNLSTALVLLQRPDIDVTLKDSEGYTAFDLYNSTVEGTKPRDKEDARLRAELFTWGANRNAALGHGDADDRAFPDQINLEPVQPRQDNAHIDERFAHVPVRQVVMSKLHTGVVTTEPKSNFRACGFGSGGRLGPGQHTQYSLIPMPQLPQPIASVALGQDHTLALTTSGEVFSWGLNRFAQLGYTLEASQGGNGKTEEQIQSVPRKIGGPLGKKVVIGVAACKTASACWTSGEVYTWGTNNGQLGYDKNAHPVQVLPRLVPRVSQPVLSVAIADNAMACLLESHDVLCLYNDSHFRVTFPAHGFPSEIKIYRPPQAVRSTSIEKITTCDNVFAALSSNGELFTFSLPNPPLTAESTSGAGSASQGRNREVVRPQRVWALRKKFSAVKDVALGADGSIIICTESGHVFVRARTTGKAFKFQRVPYLQRVVRVCANSTGAFGALRVDADLDPIELTGNLLSEDLALIQPYFPREEHRSDEERDGDGGAEASALGEEGEVDEQDESPSIAKDQRDLVTLCRALLAHKTSPAIGPFSDDTASYSGNRHGADLIIHVQAGSQPKIPAHCLVLAARSSVFADVLSGVRTVEYKHDTVSLKVSLVKQSSASLRPTNGPALAPWRRPRHLTFKGCHPLTVLILLVYLYTDEVLSVWDWRVAAALKAFVNPLGIQVGKVKEELKACAVVFELPALGSALEAAFKREVPKSLVKHVLPLVSSSITTADKNGKSALARDVVLVLEDREVPCHSAILRARSPLFQAMFDADVWTLNRWSEEGVVRVEFRHLRWASVQYVMRFLYGGDREIFDVLETVNSVDELIQCMFDVMSVANELLLERLTLLCSAVILKRVITTNASSILVDATHFNSPALVRSVQRYIAQGMETFLEGHMLDDLPVDIVKQLAKFIRAQQADKSPLSRSNVLVVGAMERNAEWIALQDFPIPIVPTARAAEKERASAMREAREARMSPPNLTKRESVPGSPVVRPSVSSSKLAGGASLGEDDLFAMDGIGEKATIFEKEAPSPVPKDRVLKEPSTPSKSGAGGVDMKSIMAEAEVGKSSPSRTPIIRPSVLPASSSNWRSPPPQSTSSPATASASSSRGPTGSPWKSLAAPASMANLSVSSSPVQTPPGTPLLKAARLGNTQLQPSPQRSGSKPTSASQVSSASQGPSMGPVISPSRQTSWKNTNTVGVRRTSGSNAAWTLPPVQPVVQSSASTSGMSFAAIQQLQLEQDATPKVDKRSLLEIQEEEQARQQEADFLRWWTAEEERMRSEQMAVPVPPKRAQKPKVGRKEKSGSSKKDGGSKQDGPKKDGSTRVKQLGTQKPEGSEPRVQEKNPHKDGSNPTGSRRKKKPAAEPHPQNNEDRVATAPKT
ncbi:hypothetical protein BC629DRAFT_1684927 [Irpex lacteus]|nr:hypothetical protein BC629DRAFT_1684927 [Irpex lacteus]